MNFISVLFLLCLLEVFIFRFLRDVYLITIQGLFEIRQKRQQAPSKLYFAS